MVLDSLVALFAAALAKAGFPLQSGLGIKAGASFS
jgi:hypothetical protein